MGKFRLNRIKGEAGLTLVEVLAALVILSIVFIGFMMIFPQMTNFNAKTGTKLTTMNIARQEIMEIQSKTFTTLNLAEVLDEIPGSTKFVPKLPQLPTPNVIEISYKKGDYDYRAEFFEIPDLVNTAEGLGNNQLHKVRLKVMVEGANGVKDKVSSETYGYIEVAR